MGFGLMRRPGVFPASPAPLNFAGFISSYGKHCRIGCEWLFHNAELRLRVEGSGFRVDRGVPAFGVSGSGSGICRGC